METEIKLALPPAARPLVEAHPVFAETEPRTSLNVSTYYDTPDFALRQRGVALRVRKAGEGYVQTVKSRDGGDGFASRGEWEWPIASDALDREAVARDAAAWAHVADVLDRVAPIFVTDIRRVSRVFVLEGQTTVEAVLDSGEVRAGERHQAIDELELELKGGPVGPMLRLAADLAERADLRIGSEAKSERGYALLTDVPPPTASAVLALPDGITVGEAFPLMTGVACRDLATELAGAARGEVEGIHRLRAAIRRLRTLFVLFAPHLDGEGAERFDRMLGDFGRTLGQGRDWDVFLTETLPSAEAELGLDTLAPLRDAATERDREAHATVTAAIDGALPTELLLGLSLWTADAAWIRPGAVAESGAPFADVLPRLLDRLERKALKRGRRLKSRDAHALHSLRKSLKKLRYACEDVASLFERRPVERYVGAIKRVLRDLGTINDSAVTAERVADLAPPDRDDLAPAAASLLAWNERRRQGSERDLRRRWRRFRHTDPFWG